MKTFIGAAVGIIIIVLIVIFARSHKSTSSGTSMQQTGATQQTAVGLQVTTVKEGTGVGAVKGDSVTVNYTGMLDNGTVFDSNVDPKFSHVQPFTFNLGAGMVIQGWDQGVLGMKVGEKRHLVIPANLAYGDRGAGALIPPGATLTFDVEVVSIKHQ
ncbi:MAG: FKBP-type peptidyl-prolyl cis-trans isomerase [bacterium]